MRAEPVAAIALRPLRLCGAVRRLALWLVLAGIAAGCAREELLPGERFGLRELDEASQSVQQLPPESAAGQTTGPVPQPVDRLPELPYTVTGSARPISLPAQRVNADWTQLGGSAQHTITHPALGPNLQPVWSTSIGTGNMRRVRVTADPVVSGGRVITMDALSEVRAHSAANGGLIWQRNLTPPTETAGQAAGGGLAIGGGRVFVTTGYGTLSALDLATGGLLWTQVLDANPADGPTVDGGIVYVSGRDGIGWAIDAETGRVLWQIEGGPAGAGTLTGAAPVIADRSVIFPFGSGEVVAALRRGGVPLWTTAVTGQRRGRAYAGIGDITGGPVVSGAVLYTANAGGRLAALAVDSGERLWTVTDGALSPVWPTGGSVFLVTDQNQLKRLTAADGSEVWSAQLPLYVERRVRRLKGVYAHYGPVLAGGRLIVASSDRRLRQIDPASGRLLASTPLPAAAASNPVVAGRTLFLVTGDGQLHAFR